jgi:hypothetical protein
MSVWVLDYSGCWHLRARFIAVAKPAVIVASAGCAAIGIPALLRSPEPVAIVPPRHHEVMLPPGAFARPSFDARDELVSPAVFVEPVPLGGDAIVLFPPSGPGVPVHDFAPAHEVPGSGALAVLPSLLVVIAMRRRA